MDFNPLTPDILFHIGPVPISRPVVTTWAIMAFLVIVSALGTRNAKLYPGALQAVLEIVIDVLARNVREILGREPWPYLPITGTLFIFLVFANLSAVIPGMKPPTGHIETPAALAGVVFLSVHYFGIRAQGLKAYAQHYLKPNPLLLPLNLLSEITRTFSLLIRLFGNIMSHELVIGIIVSLAGLLLPIPFLLLGIMIGIIQAYIFTVLATVYIGAAISSIET